MKILARHKWVSGATITESVSADSNTRRFTATIRGWTNWKLWEGPAEDTQSVVDSICSVVRIIRDRIDADDPTVFQFKGYWLPKPEMVEPNIHQHI